MPLFLKKIIDKIDYKQNIDKEPITIEDFKTILTNTRITKTDVSDIQYWLISKGYIKSISGKNIVVVKSKYNIHNGIRLDSERYLIKMTCNRCGYIWEYKGKAHRACCPKCKFDDGKNSWIKTGLPKYGSSKIV